MSRKAQIFKLDIDPRWAEFEFLNTIDLLGKELLRYNYDLRNDSGVFSPSLLTKKGCTRRMVYQVIYTPKFPLNLTKQDQETMLIGNMYHDMVQKLLGRSKKIYFHAEVPSVHPTLPIAGSADGVVIDRETNLRYILEIKTMSEKRYSEVTDANHPYIRDEVSVQQNTYKICHGIHWGVILLICKGQRFRYRQIVTGFSQEKKDWVEGLVKDVLANFVLAGELPARQEGSCKFCPYQKPCAEDWEFEKCDRRLHR